ncbi:MAG: 4'-phosphopantetheinyl transferase superfamily protein [Syntrophales bacterium]|nr:4'-phosphopantetheinyl transferase superfamily protein [Syntrophales bacterium]
MKRSGNCRFLSLVFTPSERKMIQRAAEPDRMLWAFWAAKEAAFKIFRQSGEQAVFNPRAYEVAIDGRLRPGYAPFERGCVACRSGPVFVRIDAAAEYIHCVGTGNCAGLLDSAVWGVEKIAENEGESAGARRIAAGPLSLRWGIPESGVEIRREKARGSLLPPRVFIAGVETDTSISLSHDRPYAAYAFLDRS